MTAQTKPRPKRTVTPTPAGTIHAIARRAFTLHRRYGTICLCQGKTRRVAVTGLSMLLCRSCKKLAIRENP